MSPEDKLAKTDARIVPFSGSHSGEESAAVAIPKIQATPFTWIDPASLPRREWVYGYRMIRKYVSLTVAPSGLGKSSLTIAEALALATGRNLLGTPVIGGPKRVWLWNLEDPIDELQLRVTATMQHHGITEDDLGGRFFLDSGRVQALCIAKQDKDGTRILEPVVAALQAELKARQIDVLIVDPFVSSHSVQENDNGAIDMVAKRWGAVAGGANCAIELVHHLRKMMGGSEATVESARGAVALVAAARSVRVLSRMTEEEAKKAGLETHKRHFRIGDEKNNLAPPGANGEWFELKSEDLANGESVGVVTSWKWPDAFKGLNASDLRAVQEAIEGKEYRASIQAKEWVGCAVAEVLGLDITDDSAKERVKALIKTWLKTGALAQIGVVVQGHKRPIIVVGKWVEEGDASPC